MPKITKAQVREGSWLDISLTDFEGDELPEDMVKRLPKTIKAICVDSYTGKYVLTADENFYFIAQSIDLEFV